MTTRNFDSSQLTARKGQRTIAASFLSSVGTAPNNYTLFSRPYLGNMDSSNLYDVTVGNMTEFTRYDTCVGISPGGTCPGIVAPAYTNTPPYIPQIPGAVTGVTFIVGSIIISWTAPVTGDGPFSYIVTPYLNGVAQPAVTTSSTSYRFTNLQELQPYTFTVCAVGVGGQGPTITTQVFMSPPANLSNILKGDQTPVDIGPSLTYIVNYGINSVLNYAASVNLGPTISARLMYVWVASVAQAWNWVCNEHRVSGVHDNWDWTANTVTPLADCDCIVWLATVIDTVTPLIVPAPYTSVYTYDPASVTRVKTAGNWSAWQTTWQVWFAGRQADGYTQAITTMPTGSANWNNTIVVDGTTVTNISAFPQPQQWTRLTVQGTLQKYATYTWDSVTSTCALSGQTETELQQQVLQAFPPLTGSERDAEIDSMMQIVQTLTDTQKVQAEFWAGSAKGSVSPPHMAVWLWKEYVRSIIPTCPTIIFSLLDLAVNLFENSRFVWGLKGQIMQDRPIQEVRRRYTGITLQSWNGTVDGSQWVPFQRANFVTPPFPDYSSGHSAFTSAFSLVMTKWFNATITKNPITYDNLPIMCPLFTATQTTNYGDFLVSQGTSLVQPGVAPSQSVMLSFNQWSDIATSAGMSRLYGGIHTLVAHQASQFAATNCVKPQVDSTWNIMTVIV